MKLHIPRLFVLFDDEEDSSDVDNPLITGINTLTKTKITAAAINVREKLRRDCTCTILILI